MAWTTCFKGTVKNGVVVLEPGVTLPEGTVGRGAAEAPAQPSDAGLVTNRRMDGRAVDTGLSDLVIKIAHDLGGQPTVTHGSKRLA